MSFSSRACAEPHACVLPMVPILSSIIAGQAARCRLAGFLLSELRARYGGHLHRSRRLPAGGQVQAMFQNRGS